MHCVGGRLLRFSLFDLWHAFTINLFYPDFLSTHTLNPPSHLLSLPSLLPIIPPLPPPSHLPSFPPPPPFYPQIPTSPKPHPHPLHHIRKIGKTNHQCRAGRIKLDLRRRGVDRAAVRDGRGLVQGHGVGPGTLGPRGGAGEEFGVQPGICKRKSLVNIVGNWKKEGKNRRRTGFWLEEGEGKMDKESKSRG